MNKNKYILVALALVLSGNARTAVLEQHLFDNVTWDPWVYSTLEWNDNRRLQVQEQESAWGSIVDIAMPITLSSARTNWKITPRYRVNQFVNSTQNPDTDDGFLGSSLRHSFSDRMSLQVETNANETNLVFSEFDDTGILARNGDRRTLDALGSLAYQWTDRISTSATLFAQDVAYVGTDRAGFVDYSYFAGTLDANYAYSQRWQFNASIGANFFNTPDNNGNALSYTGRTGVQYIFSETLSISSYVGFNHSELKFEEIQSVLIPGFGLVGVPVIDTASDTGLLYGATIDKQFQALRINAGYSRSITPSGRGVQTEQESLVAEGEFDIGENFVGFAEMEKRERLSQSDLIGALDTKFQRYRIGARYRFNRFWSVEGRYTYRKIERSLTDTQATSNALEFIVRFAGYNKILHRF